MIFIFFLFNILTSISIHQINGEIVEQSIKWPVPLESFVNFTITKQQTANSKLFVKIVNHAETVLSHKSFKISQKIYVDISTDYFMIKNKIKILDSNTFLISMKFFKKSYGHYLVFDFFEDGINNGEILYKEVISLTKKWRIDLKVQVKESVNGPFIFVNDSRLFQPGKIIKVICSAYDGLPPADVYVHENLSKKFKEVIFDKSLNQWMGIFTLTIDDHNRDLSCQIRDSTQNQSYKIIVNHPTTAVKLTPEYDGYMQNGTKILCQPLDGYPAPVINWVFVSAKNHSKPNSLFDVNNDELLIRSTIPVGTQMEFNCSAVYKNPLDDEVTTITRTFSFIVGDKPNNITTLNMAAIGAGVAGIVIMIIAVTIVIMLCRSKPKPSRTPSNQQQGSPKYAGSLLAGSKSALRNQVKSQNGSNAIMMSGDSSTADPTELNYDDMPRGRRPIKVVDDPVIYSTIVGTMQPKSRPSLDLGPIDRV